MQRRYKIAMIGLGSIGKRHLINIDNVLRSRNVEYSIDLIRRKTVSFDKSLSELISNVYIEHENIPDDYDVIFITNPTHLHYDTIKEFCYKTKICLLKTSFDKTSTNISDLSLDTKGYITLHVL